MSQIWSSKIIFYLSFSHILMLKLETIMNPTFHEIL